MEENPLDAVFKSRSYIAQWGENLEQQACRQMQDEKRYQIIVEDVGKIIKHIYNENFDITMFGSRVTGLATKDTSDIDLFIDTSKSEGFKINSIENENWMLQKSLEYVKKNAMDKWRNVHAIFTCRTPVLKMHHIEADLRCDITVMSKLGVANTKMMTLFIKNTPYLRQMILIAREWLIYLKMTDLHNYTISLLVLFYLQIEKYAVSVNDLKFECKHFEEDPSGYEMADFDTINYKNFTVKDISTTNLYDLLIGFFEYYSLFDFDNDVVCPLLGHTIKKRLFEKNLKKLPPEMHIYIENVKKKGPNNYFKTNMPMCVQDPLDLSHNLIKVSRKNFTRIFQENCLYTVKLLKSLP